MKTVPQAEMIGSLILNPEVDASIPVGGLDIKDRRTEWRPGGERVAIRVHFEGQGAGTFRAGDYDTARGTRSAWMKPQAVLNLKAFPEPGHRFSHWMIDREFSGSNPFRRVLVARGMIIRAVFVSCNTADIRS